MNRRVTEASEHAHLFGRRVQINVLAEVLDERDKQDAQWGGPNHDDEHHTKCWLEFIHEQMEKSNHDVRYYGRMELAGGKPDHLPTAAQYTAMDRLVRDRLVKIAALAVAGIESIDRRIADRKDKTT